jgi:prevent-host-death family protein
MAAVKQQISLREALQHLSRYVDAVQRGNEVVITRRGRPVARLVTYSDRHKLSPEQKLAWERLKASARALGIKKWRREELYENV